MLPGRRTLGSPYYDPTFARTFASGRASLQGTRRAGGGQNPQGPSATTGRTTVIAPGDPHYFGARIDRAAARAISTLCRCRNPDGHGDAWAMIIPRAGIDLRGRQLSWKDLSNRVLDHCRKDTVNREEEYEAYQYILTPYFYYRYMRHYHEFNRAIGAGAPIILSDTADAVQFHGDGHVRNHVTEEGLRTVVNLPGGSSGTEPSDGAGLSRR